MKMNVDEIFFKKYFLVSRIVPGKISRQILYEFFVQLAFHFTESSLRKRCGEPHFLLTLSN